MISKNDCLILLNDIKNSGNNVSEQITFLIKNQEPNADIVKFINENRQLDLTNFYEKVRKSYNEKKSKLYINIVKEIEEPQEVLTTLSALLTQILLFSRGVENKPMFLRSSRAPQISLVLNNYFKTYDITTAQKLLKIIKADIKVCEYSNGREI